jgi:hypothetical protein
MDYAHYSQLIGRLLPELEYKIAGFLKFRGKDLPLHRACARLRGVVNRYQVELFDYFLLLLALATVAIALKFEVHFLKLVE